MKPTRRMASIRAGCWCRVPYEPETVSAKITESAGENSRVSGWQQQYFAGVYYGVILADTVVRVWGIVRETRRGQYPVPPSAFLRDGSIVLLEQITTMISANAGSISDHLMPGRWMPFAAASRSASGRLFRKEKTCLRKAIYKNSSGK